MRMIRTVGAGAAALVASAGLVAGIAPSTAHAETSSRALARVEPACDQSLALDLSLYSGTYSVRPGHDGGTDCRLAQGAFGEGVRALQRTLNKCYHRGIAEDSDFGPATKAALQSAQRTEGIDDDGIYGQQTRFRLLVRANIDGTNTFFRCY